MQYTVRQLAELVGGAIIGDGDLLIQSARTLQDAQPGDITFVENEKHLPRFLQSHASAAVTLPKVVSDLKTLIQVADPLMAFVILFRHFQGRTADQPTGIDPRTDVHASAQIGADASIHAFACVGATFTSRVASPFANSP